MISFGVVSGSKTVHLVCFYIHTLKTHFYGVVSGSVSGSVLEGFWRGPDTHDVSILGLDTCYGYH